MKVVILAGGYGTRISEESQFKPKPMIDLCGRPILWHIMKSYSQFDCNEFIICAGYKQQVIKEFFAHYYLYRTDVTFDMSNPNTKTYLNSEAEPWTVTVSDTGLNTMTAGRVKRIQEYIGNEPFLLTYGDGVCDVDINKLIDFHCKSGKMATLTAIQPGGRFGNLEFDNNSNITQFAEKRKQDGGWINGGYMILEPEIFNYIEGDNSILEKDVLELLASKNELCAYKYDGFWQCMDTLRDKLHLENLIQTGKAPWINWEN